MVFQAIRTRYHPPTNYKGSRYSATCAAGRIVVASAHELDNEGNHIAARKALQEKIAERNRTTYGTDPSKDRWLGSMVAGCLPNGDYCHIFVEVT